MTLTRRAWCGGSVALAGWDGWREAHFGLTAADRRLLTQPEPLLDPQKRASLLDTVMQQDRHPDADAVQFAVVRMSADRDQARAVFISDQIAIDFGQPDPQDVRRLIEEATFQRGPPGPR